MKKIIIIILTVIYCCKAFSQFDSLKLSDLNIPTSPALVFTDKSPSSIEKPTNAKALGLSLINLSQGGAIEFAPYWFWDHPAYTFDNYMHQNFPIQQTFALSAATIKTDTSTALSFGFRTQLIRIFNVEQMKAVKDIIVGYLSVPRDKLDTNAIKKQLSLLKSKPILDIEIAGAYLGTSPGNSYTGLSANKLGSWLNISFSPPRFPLDIIGLVRYSKVFGSPSKTGSDSSFVDFGLSLSFLKANFDVAVEYINRHDFLAKADYNRFDFVANYQITDYVTLVASFGKNFGKVDDIISLFGIKVGLSKEKIKP
jgi:hypothetical protein